MELINIDDCRLNWVIEENRLPISKMANCLRQVCLQDKDLVIKGSNAYVSYIRSYKEHQLQSIFQLKDIDIV